MFERVRKQCDSHTRSVNKMPACCRGMIALDFPSHSCTSIVKQSFLSDSNVVRNSCFDKGSRIYLSTHDLTPKLPPLWTAGMVYLPAIEDLRTITVSQIFLKQKSGTLRSNRTNERWETLLASWRTSVRNSQKRRSPLSQTSTAYVKYRNQMKSLDRRKRKLNPESICQWRKRTLNKLRCMHRNQHL